MICRSCLRAASRTRVPATSHMRPQRFFSTSHTLANAAPISATTATQTAPRQGDSSSSHTPSTATSTSAAQPFSAPLTPAADPAVKAQAAEAAKKKAVPLVKSSIPAGQPLKGLNFLKNAQDPIAMSDDEYPAWLWTILDRQEKKADGAGAGDLFCTYLLSLNYWELVNPEGKEMLTFLPSQIKETATCSCEAFTQGTGHEPGDAGPESSYLRANH